MGDERPPAFGRHNLSRPQASQLLGFLTFSHNVLACGRGRKLRPTVGLRVGLTLRETAAGRKDGPQLSLEEEESHRPSYRWKSMSAQNLRLRLPTNSHERKRMKELTRVSIGRCISFYRPMIGNASLFFV